MLGKVEVISGKLPQNAEGDVFGDERDGDAGNKSNKVGGENRWYPAVVVAEDRRFITVVGSNFSPEPAKEEHARHCADKEDGLKIEVLGLSLSLSPTCEKAGIQDSSQTQSRSLTIDLRPRIDMLGSSL